MQLNISISGDAEVQAKLARLGTSLFEFGPLMKEIGGRLVKFYASVPFSSEGSIYGGSWAALSQPYGSLKDGSYKRPNGEALTPWQERQHYPGKGILQRTGKMQNAFFFAAGSTSVEIGNSRKVGKWNLLTLHNTGSGHLPQRIVMAITRDNANMILNLAKEDIEKKLAAA